jgi:hypothetical protein
MATEEILYTDGQDVVVTASTFQVKDKFYRLKAIKKHGVAILQPVRFPGLLVFIAGVVLSIMGLADAFTENMNVLAQWVGILLAMGGLSLTIALRERYAVQIDTPEGEKLAVVSSKREHITEIINALNRAFMNMNGKNSIGQQLNNA